MKKTVISLLLILSLVLGASLVACDDSEYDDYEEPQTNNTETNDENTDSESSDDTDETKSGNVLDFTGDTNDGWGIPHKK